MPDGNYPEDWRTLCELASKEQDPKELMRLLQKLNEALDRRVTGAAQSVTNSALGVEATQASCDLAMKRRRDMQ